MTRLRPDGLTGFLSVGAVTAGVTILSSPGFANLPVVASPDYLCLRLDPSGGYGTTETVTVTAHAASATTVTVNPTVNAHNTGARQEDWLCGPLGEDFVHGTMTGLSANDHPQYFSTASHSLVGSHSSPIVASDLFPPGMLFPTLDVVPRDLSLIPGIYTYLNNYPGYPAYPGSVANEGYNPNINYPGTILTASDVSTVAPPQIGYLAKASLYPSTSVDTTQQIKMGKYASYGPVNVSEMYVVHDVPVGNRVFAVADYFLAPPGFIAPSSAVSEQTLTGTATLGIALPSTVTFSIPHYGQTLMQNVFVSQVPVGTYALGFLFGGAEYAPAFNPGLPTLEWMYQYLYQVNVPAGYLLCDGTDVARADQPGLFNAIGTQYGTGDGVSTFGLPGITPDGLTPEMEQSSSVGMPIAWLIKT